MTNRRAILAVLVAVGLIAAGCGGDDDDGGNAEGDGGAGELTEITVGILPIADLAPLYHGIEAGYFEEEA